MDPATDNEHTFLLGSFRCDWLRPDVLCYRVDGELGECDELSKALAAAVRKDTLEHLPRHILFDLTRVTFAGGSGWECLAVALRYSGAVDGSVKVIFGLDHTPSVRQSFHRNGLPRLAPEYESVEAAIAALESTSGGLTSLPGPI